MVWRHGGKRAFDVAVSGFALLVLWPVFLVTAILIRLDSSGHALFYQERIGRNFRPFTLWKFRTMQETGGSGPRITAPRDLRVTRVGRFLRRFKLDELPQLVNVLRGDMALVGPRPEVRRFVEMRAGDFEVILRVRPGLTDPASIAYRNEAGRLAGHNDAEREADYVGRILPDKLRLSRAYVDRMSFWSDLGILMRTLYVVVFPR